MFYGAEQKIEMNTVSSILEKLRLKKCANEFKITPQGFTTWQQQILST